ncbi:MAG TPA: glycerol-3-phosphate 1-O-acyltransferase PlsY [Candidatus Limnocylindrales bacterium]|nr:glycerol-3-phosphate 1-O-acyltransferase PlsY [Candidatus Limnocylindrales bacterium]
MEPTTLLRDAILVVGAYLVGSIPMGVLMARATGGPDPRTIGSGRTGGTNALRALGRGPALIVVAGDVAKGAVPVLLARLVTGGDVTIEVLCGLAAVLGAWRSVFLGFHGGRGVATGVGTMLVIEPWAVILAMPVFVGVILVTRYVSLGSLLGSAALIPAMVILWLVADGQLSPIYIVYTVAGVVLIWLAHADNIDRLVHGRERKIDLGSFTGRSSGS